MKREFLPLILLLTPLFVATAHATDVKETVELSDHFKNSINTYCVKCHREKSDSDVRFDNFSTLNKAARLELLAKAEEQDRKSVV